MTWDEVKELGPFYVLGVLDLETANQVEDFLRQATPEQLRELAEWREVAALLPNALPQPAVPAHLKDRLLVRIAREKEPVLSLQNGSTAKVLRFQPRPRSQSQAMRWLAIAAILALAFASVFLARKNAEVSDRLRQTEEQVREFLSPDTRIITMAGVESPQASAKVVWNTRSQNWKVYIRNLPVLSNDKDYQLWYVTKDAKINAKVFSPNSEGNIEFDLALPPEAVNGLAATAVTLEPKGGSPQPTGKFYLLAQI